MSRELVSSAVALITAVACWNWRAHVRRGGRQIGVSFEVGQPGLERAAGGLGAFGMSSASRVAPGDPVVVAVVIKNVGESPAEMTVPGDFVDSFGLSVVGPSGKEVLTEYGKRMHTGSRPPGYSLEPGKEDVRIITLSRKFDFSVAGKYIITTLRWKVRDGFIQDDTLPVAAKIEITVDESLPKADQAILPNGEPRWRTKSSETSSSHRSATLGPVGRVPPKGGWIAGL